MSHAKVLPLIAALALLSSPGASPADEDQTSRRFVNVSGTVVADVTGAPVRGAVVSTLGRVARTDEEGRFTIADVEPLHDARVNFRITNEFGTVVGCAFVELPVGLEPVGASLGTAVAVAVADTRADVVDLELTLREVSAEGVDEFCGSCHSPNPCLAKPDEGGDWRTVTVMRGLVVKERDFNEIKEKLLTEGVKPDLYPSLRYQDAHPQGLKIADFVEEDSRGKTQFRLPEEIQLSKEGKTTCDTCHTRHLTTENGMFLRLDAVGQPLLCRQCHL